MLDPAAISKLAGDRIDAFADVHAQREIMVCSRGLLAEAIEDLRRARRRGALDHEPTACDVYDALLSPQSRGGGDA